MARFSMAPREGHIHAMKHLFGYVKQFPHGQIIIDDSEHIVKAAKGQPEYDWSEYYPEAEEIMPPDMPTPKGRTIKITAYKDADFARDVVTRQSVTGILLFMNNRPVSWVSKQQKTVETSMYGSELNAARIATELIMEYCYKLRMLGVPIEGSSILCGDN
jgi:hypothetical protein